MRQYKWTPLSEVTLRKYERPDPQMGERDHLKLLCLSLGLLQPGDSRDVVVDILAVLVAASKNREFLDVDAVQERVIAYRSMHKLEELGSAQSNIRRQMRRLRELMLVEKVKNTYRITEFSSLKELLDEKIIRYIVPTTLSRIKEIMELLE